MIVTPINHISRDERGVAYISGTRIKVSHIAIERNVWNKTPERIQEDFPHLSMAQIYAALAYYCDNQEQIDAEIAASERFAEEMRSQQTAPLTREMLERRMDPHQPEEPVP